VNTINESAGSCNQQLPDKIMMLYKKAVESGLCNWIVTFLVSRVSLFIKCQPLFSENNMVSFLLHVLVPVWTDINGH